MAVSKRLRYEVLRRDEFRCRYCGTPAAETALTIDHVIPVALGGKDEPENLVAACTSCNSGKSSTRPDEPVVAEVAAHAMLWQQAKDRAIAAWREQAQALEADLDEFESTWNAWHLGDDPEALIPIDADWRSSVAQWLQRGFDIDDLIGMVPTAMRKKGVMPTDRWRYLCGVVWRTLDKIDESISTEAADGGDEDFVSPEDQAYIDGYEAGMAAVDEGAAYEAGWRDSQSSAQAYFGRQMEALEDEVDELRRHVAAARQAGHHIPRLIGDVLDEMINVTEHVEDDD